MAYANRDGNLPSSFPCSRHHPIPQAPPPHTRSRILPSNKRFRLEVVVVVVLVDSEKSQAKPKKAEEDEKTFAKPFSCMIIILYNNSPVSMHPKTAGRLTMRPTTDNKFRRRGDIIIIFLERSSASRVQGRLSLRSDCDDNMRRGCCS